MADDVVEIKEDNYGYPIQFTVKEEDETVLDLTGFTAATLKVWNPGGTLLFSQAVSIKEAVNGLVEYTPQAAHFTTIGEYYGEIELSATGVVRDTKTFTIRVLETAPAA